MLLVKNKSEDFDIPIQSLMPTLIMAERTEELNANYSSFPAGRPHFKQSSQKKETETALSNGASFFEPCHYNINIDCSPYLLTEMQITTEQPPALVLKEATNAIQLCISSKNPPIERSHKFTAIWLQVSPLDTAFFPPL